MLMSRQRNGDGKSVRVRGEDIEELMNERKGGQMKWI